MAKFMTIAATDDAPFAFRVETKLYRFDHGMSTGMEQRELLELFALIDKLWCGRKCRVVLEMVIL